MLPRLIKGLTILFGVALVAAVAVSPRPSEGALSAKSRIFDRTLICSIPTFAGVRSISVRAQSGLRDFDQPSRWKALASFSLITGSDISGTVIAGSQAGAPKPEIAPSGTLSLYTKICRVQSTRVPSSPKGLQGGVARKFGDEYDCAVPRRIVVRIRGVLSAPASLRFDARNRVHSTNVPVRAAYLVVRTRAGTPLAYSEAFESGKARVFTARSCVED